MLKNGGNNCGPNTLAALICGVALALASPAHGAPAAPEANPTPVRVGTSADYPPLDFEENGKIVGIEPEFAAQLSQDLGVPFEIVQLPWTDLIPSLRAGKIDVIMSGMSITDERSELVSFCDPYLQVGQMALIRKQDRTRLDDPAAMRAEGVRVGVSKKTTGEAFAREKLKSAKIVVYPSIEEAIAALRKGELDYVIHDAPTIWRVVGRPPHEDPDLVGLYRPLTDEYLAWAVRKDDDGFRKRLNSALSEWRKSGQLEHIIDHWITIRKVSIELAPR